MVTTDGMHVFNTATARAMLPWGTTPACMRITLTYILSSVGPWPLVTSEQSHRFHFPPLLHIRQCSTCSQLHSCCQQCCDKLSAVEAMCCSVVCLYCVLTTGVTSVHVVCVNFEPVFSYTVFSPVHIPLACTPGQFQLGLQPTTPTICYLTLPQCTSPYHQGARLLLVYWLGLK